MRRRLIVGLVVCAAIGAGALLLRPTRSARLPARLHVEELVTELSEPVDPSVRVAKLQPGHELRADAAGRTALIASPPATWRRRLTLPAGAVLRFAVGVQGDGQRDTEAAGVRFAVALDGRERFSLVVNPAAHHADRHWFDERVDLGVTAAHDAELVLSTTADGSGRPSGTPGWSHIRIVRDTWRDRQPARADAPSVLVLLVDTLRADSLGIYGAAPNVTPALDAFARDGLVFAHATAQAPWTMPSVASLMTGVLVRSHGVTGDPIGMPGEEARPGDTYLPDALPTIAELAARAGISTVGISANPLVSRATNYARGFETFRELELESRSDGRTTEKNWAPAPEVNAAFTGWLGANRSRRFLAYLHYMEPHHPYTPPARFRPPTPTGIRPRVADGHLDQWEHELLSPQGPTLPDPEVRYLRALYDGEVRAWDDAFAGLLRDLDALGRRGDTIVVVTADHGEEFMEHGRLMHGTHLFDEVLHVPLVIVGPGIRRGGVETSAQGIDVLPTVAALLGLTPPAGLPGHDLLADGTDHPVVSETRNGRLADGTGTALVSLRTRDWKLIQAPALGRASLFDLAHDPGEHDDRFATAPEAAPLTAELTALLAAAPAPPAATANAPGVREKLKALGYVE